MYTLVDSPIGELLLRGSDDRLTHLHMQGGRTASVIAAGEVRDDGAFTETARQLREYFAGERTAFDLELAPQGTPFQLLVWERLREIPYGETLSYGELAREIGRPNGSRAVGLANGRNPIPIVIPCHRVIGADGTLTGYAGGIERKRLLLDLEQEALF